MELLFIWIKEYKCFENEGFNFSPKHRFKFNYKTSTLKYVENKECINYLFCNKDYENKDDGKIKNITTIVGNNGSGKTTLLEMIFRKFVDGRYKKELEGIFCFLDGDIIKVYCDTNEKIYLETNMANEEKFEILGFYNKKNNDYSINNIKKYIVKNNYTFSGESTFYPSELDKNTSFIHYSNTFDEKYYRYPKSGALYDISTIGLIRSDKSNGVENYNVSLDKDPNINFFQNDFYRQIQFIYDFQKSKDYIDFDLPSSATVGFTDLHEAIEQIYKMLYSSYGELLNNNQRKKLMEDRLKEYEEKSDMDKLSKDYGYIKLKLVYSLFTINQKLNGFVIDRNKRELLTNERLEVNDFGIKLIHGIFIKFLYEYIISYYAMDKDELYKIILKNVENYITTKIDIINDVEDIFEYIKSCMEQILKDRKIVNEQNMIFIKSIVKFQKWIKSNPVEKIKFSYLDKIFILEVNNDSNAGMESLKNFYDAYKETARYFNYLEFSWGVSTGEYNMISLFARFYSLIEKINKKRNKNISNDIIILIDEADMTFHPEWQQQYIKKLINFLQVAYKKCNLQLIMTTHSPIMLSDIPNENVIFLYKDKGKKSEVKDMEAKTFASNIYNIYRNGFFLNGSNFGILGDFAVSKIEEVKNIMAKWENIIIEFEKNMEECQEDDEKNISTLDENRFKMPSEIRESAKKEMDYCRKIINLIGEEFIRDTLYEQYNSIFKHLTENDMQFNNKTLDEIIDRFDELSEENQNELIKYIIQKRKK